MSIKRVLAGWPSPAPSWRHARNGRRNRRPGGEKATPSSALTLSDAEVAKLKTASSRLRCSAHSSDFVKRRHPARPTNSAVGIRVVAQTMPASTPPSRRATSRPSWPRNRAPSLPCARPGDSGGSLQARRRLGGQSCCCRTSRRILCRAGLCRHRHRRPVRHGQARRPTAGQASARRGRSPGSYHARQYYVPTSATTLQTTIEHDLSRHQDRSPRRAFPIRPARGPRQRHPVENPDLDALRHLGRTCGRRARSPAPRQHQDQSRDGSTCRSGRPRHGSGRQCPPSRPTAYTWPAMGCPGYWSPRQGRPASSSHRC